MRLLLLIAATLPSFAQEALRYSVNWPSGLSLGEGELTSHPIHAGKDVPSRYEYLFKLDASIPGFTITDAYRSLATTGFCSIEFEKRSQHGSRKAAETTTFRPDQRIATRETDKGGKSEIPISECAKDGLAYLYWLRSELQQGRLPSPQTILFGAPYRISVKFGGTSDIVVNEKRHSADRIEADLKGPASETRFELYFGRDSSRKLLMARVPFSMGSFSMELLD